MASLLPFTNLFELIVFPAIHKKFFSWTYGACYLHRNTVEFCVDWPGSSRIFNVEIITPCLSWNFVLWNDLSDRDWEPFISCRQTSFVGTTKTVWNIPPELEIVFSNLIAEIQNYSRLPVFTPSPWTPWAMSAFITIWYTSIFYWNSITFPWVHYWFAKWPILVCGCVIVDGYICTV